jgi:hypothetical protein
VTLFRGQAKNKNSDLAFDDYSVKVPYRSDDAAYIRSRIAEKINAASVTICLIGQMTHKSEWVDWEVRKAAGLTKKVLGVRLHSDSTRDRSPGAISDVGALVLNWDIDAIVRAIG